MPKDTEKGPYGARGYWRAQDTSCAGKSLLVGPDGYSASDLSDDTATVEDAAEVLNCHLGLVDPDTDQLSDTEAEMEAGRQRTMEDAFGFGGPVEPCDPPFDGDPGHVQILIEGPPAPLEPRD